MANRAAEAANLGMAARRIGIGGDLRPDRRRRLLVLLIVLLLHLAVLLLLLWQAPAIAPAPPLRTLVTIFVPRPRPRVEILPAPHVELTQPGAMPAQAPALDLRSLLPPVRTPVAIRRSAPVVSRAPRPAASVEPGTRAGPAVGHGAGSGHGPSPCLPCVWQWERRLVLQIQSVILYPRVPPGGGDVVRVRLTMTRTGVLLSAEIVESSGHDVLDREAVDAARRASPLPPAPVDVEDNPVRLVVPVRFFGAQR